MIMAPSMITVLMLFVLPMFLLLFFKTNGGMMFLAACAGLVLLGSLDPAVVSTAGAVVPGEGESYVRLMVVMLSVFYAALTFRHTIHDSSLVLHGFITILLAISLWLLLPSATGVSWLLENINEPLWQDLNEFRSLIIASGFSLSLLSVLTQSKRHRPKR